MWNWTKSPLEPRKQTFLKNLGVARLSKIYVLRAEELSDSETGSWHVEAPSAATNVTVVAVYSHLFAPAVRCTLNAVLNYIRKRI